MHQIILDILTTGVKGLLALVALGYGAAMLCQALMRQLQRAGEQPDHYRLIRNGKPLPPVRQVHRPSGCRACRDSSPLYIQAGR